MEQTQALEQSGVWGHQSRPGGGVMGMGTEWYTHRCPSDSGLRCSCVCFLQISSSTSTHRAPRGCPKLPSWCTAGKGQVPGGRAGATGPRSLPFCLPRGPLSSPPSAFPGITAWLPWCTTDSACVPMTLSTTASHSTTPPVTWAAPPSPEPRGPQEPCPSCQAAGCSRNT